VHGVSTFVAKAGLPFFLSLFASWSALMGRYWPLRRPFGTRESSILSIAIIVLTAVISTVAAFILPRLVGAIPPYIAGLAPPALMVLPSVANRNRDQLKSTSRDTSAVIRACLSLSVAILLGRLDRLLVEQREQFGRDWSNVIMRRSDVRTRVEELCLRLQQRQQDSFLRRLKAQSVDLSAYLDSFSEHFGTADQTNDDQEKARSLLKARLAVERLLNVAYDWRAESLVRGLVAPTVAPSRKARARPNTTR
jgi:hypothetical protein